MRLKVSQPSSHAHVELVAAVGWNLSNELYSCSDDQSIWRWNMNGEPMSKVCSLDAFFTDIHWYPSASKRQQAGAGVDVFVISCTDGSFRIVGKSGREEKKIDAHRGAVIALRWNFEGTALVTAGEDGTVKVWSRSGMLRSTLAQTENCVYSVAWGPDSDHVLFSSGRELIIKPLQPSAKQLQWKGHDGTILKVDWNPVNNLILSAGEDCRFKVWDCYGRLLFQSSASDYSITSLAWCPDGELFAVGSFNSLRLCDKTGWTYSKQRLVGGSFLSVAWTMDGTQLAAAAGSGAVVFGQLIDRRKEWGRISATLEEVNRIRVQDVLSETVEELDFRDRVIKMSLGYNHLIVATATQCCIYSTSNWNTPHIFDVKDTVLLIMQCERHFLMLDTFTGLQLFSYEGRQLCNPKFQGLRTEILNAQGVSLCPDTLAVIDRSDSKSVRLFDTNTGKLMGEPIRHKLEITEIALNQTGSLPDRKLVFLDRNRDLYITPVSKVALYKLGAMVDSVRWNEDTDVLAALVDQKLTVWLYPSVVFVDRDLLPLSKFVVKEGSSEYGKSPQLTSFRGWRCTIRRMDGALVVTNVSPFPQLLYEHVHTHQWDRAIRLCRLVKEKSMWACLAAMAINAKELNTAEVAFAAIEEVDKLKYVLHIKSIPSQEGRNAELALFCRRPEEAESILLQAGLIYRAIHMHIRLFHWERALEIAMAYKTHVDTVLMHRNEYLSRIQQKEFSQKFLQLNEVVVDEERIKAKIKKEKAAEAERGDGTRQS